MRKVKLTDMTKEEHALVEKFKSEHDISRPVSKATFFWNMQEERLQVVDVTTIPNPFKG